MDYCATLPASLKQSQEPNPFPAMVAGLTNKYNAKLKQVLKAYPDHKAGIDNAYLTYLSALNGITKQLKQVDARILEKTQTYSRAVQHGKTELDTMAKIQSNLKQYTDYDTMDTTSKAMLNDVSTTYQHTQFMLWANVGVIVVLLLQSYKEKQYIPLGVAIAGTVLYAFYKHLKKSYKDEPPSTT